MTEAALKTWLEVSVLVNGELAESVSEVFSRFTHGGVAIEAVISEAGEPVQFNFDRDLVKVCAYLPVNDYIEDTRQKLDESLWYLGRIQSLPVVNYRYIQEQDWEEAWKQHYHPIAVGKSLEIVPAWLEPETGNRIPVIIDPGMAFGTGTHPSTILCLEMIEEYLFDFFTSDEHDKNQRYKKPIAIDIGCGSGILSIAALKLGAVKVLALDVDPIAVEAAHQNAEMNRVESKIEIRLGSLAEIKAGKISVGKADLVFVNILAPVIVQLLENGLNQLVKAHGQLLLSGLIADQEEQVIDTLSKCNMKIEHKRQMGDWVALAAVHENPLNGARGALDPPGRNK